MSWMNTVYSAFGGTPPASTGAVPPPPSMMDKVRAGINGETPKTFPQQSPAEQPNPQRFDMASKAQGYVAPGPSSPATMENPNAVNLEAGPGIDWKNLALAGASGIAASQAGRPEPEPISAPPVTGGQYFTMPKGNMSDGRIGGAPKGILAQNYQL